MSKPDIDWSVVEPEVIDFILYQAERHLDGQLKSATASDARAVTAASILTGLSGAILAGTLGYWLVSSNVCALWAGLVSGALLILAACFCVWAAKPVDFYVTGNQPEEWYGCLESPLKESKGIEIQNYQEMITDNATVLDKAARHLEIGLSIAVISPFAAIVAYIFATCALS